jgi:Glycine-zipper domain
MNYPIPAVLLLALLACTLAQTPPASQGSHDAQGAFSPAKSLGMFAYPQKKQNSDQQLKDENECYGSAKQQSGVDPQAAPPPAKSADQQAAEQKAAADNAKQAKGGRARGAARGAAAGATVGAIAGDAGTGAAAGAAAGTMKGGAQQRQANAAAQKQAAANTAAQQQKETDQTKAAQAQNLDSFKRAFSACMDARGYSVK